MSTSGNPTALPNFAQLFTANPTYANVTNLSQQFSELNDAFVRGNSPFSLQDIQGAAAAFQQAIQPYAQQFQEQSGQEVLARRAAAQQQQQQQLRLQMQNALGPGAVIQGNVTAPVNPFQQQAAPIPLNQSPLSSASSPYTNTRSTFSQPSPYGSGYGSMGGGFGGNQNVIPLEGRFGLVRLAGGGEVSEARRMLQRFADGGEANQLFTDEATGERYFMVKGPDGKAYRSDRPIPGVSQGLSPEEQAAYADSLRKSQDVTALGMLQRVNALRQQEEALSPNKMEWFDQAQRLMKENPNYQMLQRQRPELFDPVSSAVQEAQGAYQTEQAAPASQQLWESKVYQQNYGQGNVLDSVYRDPTTGYGVVSLRDPKGFVERGIVDQKGNFLVGGNYRAQDLLGDAQRLSPKFSENISSLLKSQGITPGVNDTFFGFQPYQQVSGQGTERTDTPFAQPVPTTTLLKDIPRTSPYQTQVDRMQELYENLSKRLKGVKGEPGMPGYTEERPFFAPFGFASGGSVDKNEESKARQMLQRFADGGDVSSGLKYATGEGGIGAAKYYENIRNFVNTQGADLNAAEVRAEMEKYGISDKDVRDALAGTQYSGAAVHALLNPDIGATDAPGRGVGGLEGMSANIRDFIQDQVAAKMTREQLGDVLTQQLGAYDPETGIGGFNEQDLVRATGKTASQLLNDLYDVNQKPPPVITTVAGGQGNDTIKGAQGNDLLLFQPPSDLPPLTDIFVPPTAPPPEAPPPALTPGQEGLDPSTAIVKAIPQSERVAIPQLDTEFRASAPRTATYDRFGRITGYNYSPAAKLTPATGTNVFKWTPPGITSRPRSPLNIGDVPGVMVDPVTGQMRLPLSASQQFARDRSTLDNQFRQLYARAAAGDKSLPAQAPTSAAAAFRDFVMSGEDPMLQNKLRFRDIEQQKYDPTKADPALRVQYGQSAFASDLAAAFDPFLARNRAALTSLAEQQTPKSYSEQYPDIAAAYAKLKPEDKAKFPTLRDYELYHFDTYGRKEGRTSPLLGMGALQSPYATAFFSKGGEASTEDFIKKQSGGDVSRGTASPTNPLDYTPGLSDKGLGAGFADPGVVEMIDRFDRNQLRSTPELTALDQLIALQESNVLNQRLANTMSVDQITGDIDPVQSLRNLQAYDPASFEATLRTLQDVPSLVPQSGLGSLRLGMEQLQGLEGVTPTQVGETANAFATMLKQPETGSQVQDIAQNIRSIIENQPLARFQTNVGFTPEGNVDPYAAFRRTGGISYKEPSGLEDPLVPPIPPGFQEGGDVSRETASPNTAEVPQLDAEGRLIDENAEMRSESQRMLNRLKTAQQESYRRGKLPQKNEDAEKVRKDIREGMRALVGMGPYDETNPTEAYRIAATPTPLAAVGMIGRKGLLGMLDKARGSTAFKGRGLDVAEAEQFSVKELMNRLKEQGIDVDRTWLRGKKDPGGGFEKPPTYEYLEAVYEYQKRPDAIELALRDAKQGRPWSRAGTVSRQPGDRDVTKANTKGGVWLTESPTIAESYSGDRGFIIPVLTRRPKVVLDAKGEQWDEFFETSKEFKEAQKDPNVKSIEVKNIIDFGGRSKLPSGLSDDELRKLLTANNLFLKKPFVDKDVVSKLTGEPFPYQDGGPVNVPRETSTSKQQLDKLAQVSQRKKA